MCKRTSRALAVAAALAASQASFAVSDEEVKELRDQLRQLEQEYRMRIEALERRLQQSQQAAAQTPSTPVRENAFNPGISLIFNGSYANLSQDPRRFRINGFAPVPGDVAPPRRGFSLAESELAIAANIDPYFHGALFAALAPDGGVEIEEAYFQTLALGNGFTLKAGRFFSGVGYQNQIHAHAWDFTDAPLVLKAFLGNLRKEDGIQFKWVAPTETYFDIGLEAGRGRDKNGFGSRNVFAHAGGDIGASTAWQVGLSQLSASAQDRRFTDLDSTGASVTDSFTGKSRLWALDGVLKWAPNQNPTVTNFKLQGEYFRRREDGILTYDTLAQSLGTQRGGLATRQSGWYLQGVVQFVPMWRAGLRYDRLSSGTTSIGLVDSGALSAADFPILGGYDPRKTTAMIDWSPSEFSRLRLQFARDTSRMGLADNQVLLQYIMSLGAHGAHKF